MLTFFYHVIITLGLAAISASYAALIYQFGFYGIPAALVLTLPLVAGVHDLFCER